jgi:hypothetical protein
MISMTLRPCTSRQRKSIVHWKRGLMLQRRRSAPAGRYLFLYICVPTRGSRKGIPKDFLNILWDLFTTLMAYCNAVETCTTLLSRLLIFTLDKPPCSGCFVDRPKVSIQGLLLSDCTSYGCAIPQAVSCRLPAAAARVRARVRSCGIYGGQSGSGAGFPCQSSFHRLLHNLSPRAGAIGQ